MSFWKRLRNRLFTPPATAADLPPVPRVAPPAPPGYRRIYPQGGIPRTYTAAARNDGAARAVVFDPALKPLNNAFRPGDPSFENDSDARRWAHLRRLATDHVLRAIAESGAGERLILRGSRLLKAWVGDAAREPGDLDWVFDPPTAGPDDPAGAALCGGLVSAVFARPAPAGVELLRAEVATDDIWTYERAPGRRIVIPWQASGLPGGAVQVDVVFRETLPDPARRASIPAADGGCVSVRAATPAQSLAWKLAWLTTDRHPQGKDAYDAALLAEQFPLPRAILAETFRRAEAGALPDTASALVGDWYVEWDNFLTEYPWVTGSESEWLDRLAKALEPTFSEGGSPSEGQPPALDPAWLTSTVVQLAQCIDANCDFGGLPILADALQDAGCDDEELLHHCRCGGAHARGCWVTDLILGKE